MPSGRTFLRKTCKQTYRSIKRQAIQLKMSKRSKPILHTRAYLNSHEQMKKCSISLVNSEIQMESIRQYHCTLIRMDTSKRLTIPSAGNNLGGTGTHTPSVKCKIIQPLWETVGFQQSWVYTYSLTYQFLGIYTQQMKICVYIQALYANVHSNQIIKFPKLETTSNVYQQENG